MFRYRGYEDSWPDRPNQRWEEGYRLSKSGWKIIDIALAQLPAEPRKGERNRKLGDARGREKQEMKSPKNPEPRTIYLIHRSTFLPSSFSDIGAATRD